VTGGGSSLRTILFQSFPALQVLKLVAPKKGIFPSTLPILPMSFGLHPSLQPLLRLKTLHLIGDFVRKSDLIYDVLKYSPNLAAIQVEKSCAEEDDLFGTWCFEIILSQSLPQLTCLELDSGLIDLQVERLLVEGSYHNLKRLSLNLTQVENPNSAVERLLRKFLALENVVFELREHSTILLESTRQLFPKDKFLLAIHSKSKITNYISL
jgi:hypothetical protein